MTPTQRPHHPRQGFTLIEILVVLAIIAILVSLVIGIAGGVQRGAAESKARAEIASMMMELDRFREERGTYPAALNTELMDWYVIRYQNSPWKITELSSTRQPLDPWGRAYVYTRNSDSLFLLRSNGADGSANTPDDISNRNGSL